MLSWLRRAFGWRPKLPLTIISPNDAMERDGVLYVRLPEGWTLTEERRAFFEHQLKAAHPQYSRVEVLDRL